MLSMLMMDILNIIIIFQSDLYALENIPTYHVVAHIHSTITKLAKQRVYHADLRVRRTPM